MTNAPKHMISLMISVLAWVFAAVLALPVAQASGPENQPVIQVFTEEFPPFNYSENGELQGVSTTIVREVLDRAGYPYEIHSLPWARAYKRAQETPNAMIYSISRREKREELFKWIAPIIPTVRYSVFALKDRKDIRIERFSDMKRYQIGTTVDDAREAYLLTRGFSFDDLQRVSGADSHRVNYEKLKRGRIELWPMPDAVMSYIVRDAGDDPRDMLRRVFSFSELTASGYYLAANKDMPDDMVQRIRAELARYQEMPEYEALLNEWGLGSEGVFANQDIR